MNMLLSTYLLLGTLVQQGLSHSHSNETLEAPPTPVCHMPGPAYPIPTLKKSDASVQKLGENLSEILKKALSSGDSEMWQTNITSFSVQLTSKTEDLYSFHHTADILGNYTDSSPTNVTSDTLYRVGSISKVFTVLSALVQECLCMDDPITKHIPELAEGDSNIHWKEITLRALASQMSGLPREYSYGDLSTVDPASGLNFDPTQYGFPPLDSSEIEPCGKSDTDIHCTTAQLIQGIKSYSPVFEPSDRPTYSNVAFNILGIALERITGKSFEAILKEDVFGPIGMVNSAIKKPKDSAGVIPDGPNQWALDFNIENPAGGIYSSVNDLTAFIRSLWDHKLLTEGQVNAWLKPTSFNPGLDSAYGMPWEIWRIEGGTPDGRTIELYMKGGAVSGYFSQLVIIPEYGIGGIILTAGDPSAVGIIQAIIGDAVIEAMEEIVREEADTYTGTFKASGDLNSTITLESYEGPGLRVTEWISNSTDLIDSITLLYGGGEPGEMFFRASPVGVTKYGGESWRMTLQFVPTTPKPMDGPGCITDIDGFRYGGESATEIIFRGKDKIWLPAFRVELGRGY